MALVLLYYLAQWNNVNLWRDSNPRLIRSIVVRGLVVDDFAPVAGVLSVGANIKKTVVLKDLIFIKPMKGCLPLQKMIYYKC